MRILNRWVNVVFAVVRWFVANERVALGLTDLCPQCAKNDKSDEFEGLCSAECIQAEWDVRTFD